MVLFKADVDLLDSIIHSPYEDLESVKDAIDRGAKNLNEALWYSCYYGYINITKYLIEQGASDFKEGMKWSTENGHIDVVKYLFYIYKNKYTDHKEKATFLLKYAVVGRKEKNLDIVKYLVNEGAKPQKSTFIHASEAGNLNIVKYLVNIGVGDANLGLSHAVRVYPNIKLIKYLVSIGANNFNEALLNAKEAKIFYGNLNPEADKVVDFLFLCYKSSYDKTAKHLVKILLRDA